MGSVSSSLNPGLADLFQTLSNIDSPLLPSPAVTSALENASPTDIVQLSLAADQLQNVDAMFGMPNTVPDLSGATSALFGNTSPSSLPESIFDVMA